MRKSDVVIIGAGQAGLVMSRALSARGIEHVVLERGRVGERWRSERWCSLHLLTPASLSALPGHPHIGVDPEYFLRATEFASYLTAYARWVGAPVVYGADVHAVEPLPAGFRVSSSVGIWYARAVVIATGACDVPYRPPMARNLTPEVEQLVPSHYRCPDQLAAGGVLVVGASATGVQLADEIQASGRPVTLAVGEHTRMPRRYAGMDIYAAMDLSGILDDPTPDDGPPRQSPSPQVVGHPDHRDLDLGTLQARDVRLLGRLSGIDGLQASFAGDLAETTARSHTRLVRTLDRIDTACRHLGMTVAPSNGRAREPVLLAAEQTTLDLRRAGIRTVLWATGYIRRYPWLRVPVLNAHGEIRHRGGIASYQGLYVLGLNFMRRRRSHFIEGCGRDAAELAPMIESHLDAVTRQTA